MCAAARVQTLGQTDKNSKKVIRKRKEYKKSVSWKIQIMSGDGQKGRV